MSKVVYLARVIKTDDGWYAIDFPDLPGSHAQCRDLADVQREAENSLHSFLLAAQAIGEEVPTPSGSLDLQGGETAVRITVDLDTSHQRKTD